MRKRLRISSEAESGHLYHYKNYRGKEIDAVAGFKAGTLSGFEIKSGVYAVLLTTLRP